MEVILERLNQAVRFKGTNAAGNSVIVEGSPEIGGEGEGVRPMELLLMSLAACSSMDVVTILKKMRQPVDDLRVVVRGERAAGEVPAVFKSIHLAFHFSGKIKPEKAAEAVRLSVEKYCSVARMLEKTATISHEFLIDDNPPITNPPIHQ